MNYPQAQNYLNSFVNYERLNSYPYRSCFKLSRMRRLSKLFGNPQRTLRAIHIAGTKGKGSTCAFVAHILASAGLKVGLYTSPHLIDVRERIRIVSSFAKEAIPRKDFLRLIKKIRPYARRLRKGSLGSLSYYEILTCLAFLYFQEQEVDFAVLETGIGGRVDATNLVSSLVCGITPISYEHTQVLGNTLSLIAREKAAIIKPNIENRPIVVTAPQKPSVFKVIKRRVKKCSADLFEVGKDIRIKQRSATIQGQTFDVQGIFGKYSHLKIGLLGAHQVINAAVAIACVESLRKFEVRISEKAIREGLKKTRWPGRLQMISRRPQVLLDAAHNRASAVALKEALAKFFKFRNLILVFGSSQDKDVRGILKELAPGATKIILTKTQSPRAMQPERIKSFIKTNKKPIITTQQASLAVKLARKEAGTADLILVSGSLYLVGEVLRLKKEKIC